MYTSLLEEKKIQRPESAIELALLADRLESERKKRESFPKIIVACVGTPTFYVNPAVPKAAIKYWQDVLKKALVASESYHHNTAMTQEISDNITNLDGAIDYADSPNGDLLPRAVLAEYLTKLYGGSYNITETSVVFTAGGTAGLNSVLETINNDSPGCKILTPFPYYWVYQGRYKQNNLYPINVMEEKGYKLNAQMLQRSFLAAEKATIIDGKPIGAFLFCDPNNPLGTVNGKEGWEEISNILRQILKKYPKIWIILDESYAGMQFNGRYISLLEVAPDIADRLIIVGSGTKILSAAGDRLGHLLIFNKEIHNKIEQTLVSFYIHVPRSLQVAYALGMARSEKHYMEHMREFYKLKVKYVDNRLFEIGISMPDTNYHPEGTFYILADCSELIEMEFPLSMRNILGLCNHEVIKNSLDIALYFLFMDGIAMAPFLYFGIDKGYVRITCSDNLSNLIELTNRLEDRFGTIRKFRHSQLIKRCNLAIEKMKLYDMIQAVSKQKELDVILCPVGSEKKITKTLNNTLFLFLSQIEERNERYKNVQSATTVTPIYNKIKTHALTTEGSQQEQKRIIVQRSKL